MSGLSTAIMVSVLAAGAAGCYLLGVNGVDPILFCIGMAVLIGCLAGVAPWILGFRATAIAVGVIATLLWLLLALSLFLGIHVVTTTPAGGA